MTLDPNLIGDRTDPHAQIRAARQQPVLLHSMSVFREMFQILFSYKKIESVIEVGVESGQVSSIYTELGASKVYCIDPYPTKELRETLAKNSKLELVERPSPQVLAELPVADLYVLDGDHNYAVVHGEVSHLVKHAPDAVIAFHDVLWPCSRRDMYYEPSLLDPEQKHPVTPGSGPTVWHDEVSPAGFHGAGAFDFTHQAGGERNGVLTAIEDAIAEADDEWLFVIVPAVFGMGVMVRKDASFAKKMLEGLKPYTSSKLLATMENNRIALYTRVLQLQYEAVAAAANHDQFAEEIAAQRAEIDRLHGEVARQSHELHLLREENAQLQRQLRDPDLAAEPNMGTVLHQLSRVAGKQIRKARQG